MSSVFFVVVERDNMLCEGTLLILENSAELYS